MRLAEVTREVSNHLNQAAERYEVPQRLRTAGKAARQGAHSAYRMALDYPRASAATGVILAAALVGGVLWYLFHDRRAASHRRPAARVRAGAERRKRTKQARAAAA